ncbi:MAG TPA: CaiB/BaiF CoA-transferase family protein [Acidimicrobiales bacterium]|nr:CaiB/BaiF CoA-transferase family protein [Acidimicrobiales bacterium]
MTGPLSGLRVVEFAGLGPCPFAAMVLADHGADVLRVDRVAAVESTIASDPTFDLMQRGKRSVGIDLKQSEGVQLALDLVERADVVLEGFRPGVMEHLGLGPDDCRKKNDRLIYGRMTGWGQSGPLASRAGHDIDYVALSGALGAIGREGERPVVPLNLVGDFGGGGLLLAFGVMAALYSARASGQGQVIDAAMIDGAALLTTMFYGLRAEGSWRDERGTNFLDTGAPFYDVYECADGKMIAVGALEAQFYRALLDVLGFIESDLPDQMDRDHWPATKSLFAERFVQKTRDEWLFAARDVDACLAPVLSMDEAPRHPHALRRGGFVTIAGVPQPAPAPRFSGTPSETPTPPSPTGGGGRAALLEWNVLSVAIERLTAMKVLVAT